MKSKSLQTVHSIITPEHGTPPEICAVVRAVLGGIDLDPASTKYCNENVKAAQFYTQNDDSLARPWAGRVFCNPPSGNRGALVKSFWKKLVAEWASPNVTAAIWIGSSIDQLQTLQNLGCAGPLRFPICVPHKRIAFMGPPDPTAPRASPSRPNFICLLPDEGVEMSHRFGVEFERFGEVMM